MSDSKKEKYAPFDLINGDHSLKKMVPKSCLEYQVRYLHGGSVTYFNFNLAKEMGLISKDHPHRMTKTLEKKILETFSLRIINEYDLDKGIQIPQKDLKPQKYMATRYLQLQHKNKLGQTSGDGRSIWNGQLTRRGKTWDISSRGTGVTALSPGAAESQDFLKTGNRHAGYGCGLAELDELYSGAILSEIFHRKGIATERMLAIIESQDGYGIGVRAGLNFIRPAHLMIYLRQNDLDSLTQIFQYFLEREVKNQRVLISPHSPKRFSELLNITAMRFGQFCAELEREYIFLWLDWDGDNVLANAGIIDYGSIRQFGLRHDEYRYDDVIKMSTTLNEQFRKARNLILVFAQMVDFIETGVKKPRSEWTDHPCLKIFDQSFKEHIHFYFLAQLGLSAKSSRELIFEAPQEVESFYQQFLGLEKAKTCRRVQKVEDGIHRPAIYNMRKLLLELPKTWNFEKGEFDLLEASEALKIILGEDTTRRDRRLTPLVAGQLIRFQKTYQKMMLMAMKSKDRKKFVKGILKRSAAKNRQDRLTGNGLIFAVEELRLFSKKKKIKNGEIQKVIDEFVTFQAGEALPLSKARHRLLGEAKVLFEEMVHIATVHKESI